MKRKNRRKNAPSAIPIEKAAINTKEAAAYISVSESFLEKDRVNKAEIPFCKVGKRGVRYRKVDLDRYLEKNLKTSTSQDSSKKTREGLEYE